MKYNIWKREKEKIRMSTIERYIYLVVVIVIIRFILGMTRILDVKIEGFIGSVLTGVTLLFLLETIDYFRKRYSNNGQTVKEE